MWRGCDNVSDPVAKCLTHDSCLCLRLESLLSLNLIKFTAAPRHQNTPTEWEPSLCREPLNSAARVCDGAGVAVSSPAAAGGAGRGCQLTHSRAGQVRGSGPALRLLTRTLLNTDANSYKFRHRSEVIFMWSYGEKSDFGARAATVTQGECFLSLKSVKCQCPVLESAEKRKHVK